jgi:hypothetical protein
MVAFILSSVAIIVFIVLIIYMIEGTKNYLIHIDDTRYKCTIFSVTFNNLFEKLQELPDMSIDQFKQYCLSQGAVFDEEDDFTLSYISGKTIYLLDKEQEC